MIDIQCTAVKNVLSNAVYNSRQCVIHHKFITSVAVYKHINKIISLVKTTARYCMQAIHVYHHLTVNSSQQQFMIYTDFPTVCYLGNYLQSCKKKLQRENISS